MTDFVGQNLKTGCLITQLQVLHKYKDFLKQILELWMFVPCKLVDGVWVVLEYNPMFNDYEMVKEIALKTTTEKGSETHNLYITLKEYQEAKDRVLFEGFKWINGQHISNDDIDIYFDSDGVKAYNGFKRTDLCSIEKLVEFKIELTPTAQKQIF
jgi:hypothetical protein